MQVLSRHCLKQRRALFIPSHSSVSSPPSPPLPLKLPPSSPTTESPLKPDGITSAALLDLSFVTKECQSLLSSSKLAFNFTSSWQSIAPSQVELSVLNLDQQKELSIAAVQLQQHASLSYSSDSLLAMFNIGVTIRLTLSGTLEDTQVDSTSPHELQLRARGAFASGLVPATLWQGQLLPPTVSASDTVQLRDMDVFDGKSPAAVVGLAAATLPEPLSPLIALVTGLLDTPAVRFDGLKSAFSSLTASNRGAFPRGVLKSALTSAVRKVSRLFVADGTSLQSGYLLQFRAAATTAELGRLLPELAHVATSDNTVSKLCPHATFPPQAASAEASVDLYVGDDGTIFFRSWAAHASAQIDCQLTEARETWTQRAATFGNNTRAAPSETIASLAIALEASSPGFDEPWQLATLLQHPLQALQLLQALEPSFKGTAHGTLSNAGAAAEIGSSERQSLWGYQQRTPLSRSALDAGEL